MGLNISFTTSELQPAEAIGLARLLESVSPGALAAAMRQAVTFDDGQVHEVTPQPLSAPATPLYSHTGPTPQPSAAPMPPPLPVNPPPPAPPASDDLDADGLPWDERIHSSNHEKNSDGRWRKKRGLNDGDLIKRVQAELRAKVGGAAPPAVDPAPVTPPAIDPAAAFGAVSGATVTAGDRQEYGAGSSPENGTYVVTPAPVVTPPPSSETYGYGQAPSDALAGATGIHASYITPPANPMAAFTAFMEKLTPLQDAGKILAEDLAAVCAAAGIPNLATLMSRPELIPTVEAQLQAVAAAR